MPPSRTATRTSGSRFLRGVSKFSKVSLFSGLNNLTDLTLDPDYSAICGYTDRDLDTVFAAELDGLDRDAIRDWYNGYSWRGSERVYNPFDILLLFRNREFDAYWFETGTPTFLVETLIKRGVSPLDLDGMTGSAGLLGTFDVDRIEPAALLFQTGYLTIQATESRGGRKRYRLGYPNREVFQSLNESLLEHLTRDPRRGNTTATASRTSSPQATLRPLEDLFRAFFAGIPYEWHTNSDIARFEAYHASVFYAYFAAVLGPRRHRGGPQQPRTRRHDRAHRRPGVRVRVQGGRAGRTRGGAGPTEGQGLRGTSYRALGEPIHLVAVEFSSATRNLAAFDHEIA